MIQDFTVRQEYMDRNTGKTKINVYPLDRYTSKMSSDLKFALRDIELLMCDVQEGKSRDDWDPEVQRVFLACRKRLLDAANNIQRFPNTLCYRGVPCSNMNIGEWLTSMNIKVE